MNELSGFISCDSFKSSDPDNLLVENHEHNMIIGQQFEPFVIPCKPTSPKVKVELIKEGGEVIKELSFDETIGFLVVSDEVIESGLLWCNFMRNNKSQPGNFMFQVDRRFFSLF